MAEQEEKQDNLAELPIRRILVALDTSTHSLAALQEAARLAAVLNAHLTGLFVEDINLLRLAALPFTQEVRWPTARSRSISERQMEQDLRWRAAQARRALAYVAEQVEAEWSFQVVRGAVTQKVLEAALDADLLSLGWVGRSPLGKRRRMGSTARSALLDASLPVLLARIDVDTEQPIIVTYDGSADGTKALATATRMAQTHEARLVVLVVADDAQQVPVLAAEASQWLESRLLHVEYRALTSTSLDKLIELLQQQAYGMIILGGEKLPLKGEELQALLEGLDCPLLIVR